MLQEQYDGALNSEVLDWENTFRLISRSFIEYRSELFENFVNDCPAKEHTAERTPKVETNPLSAILSVCALKWIFHTFPCLVARFGDSAGV